MHFPVQCESRNFKTRGRGPGAVEFLGSEVCFDAFIHTLCFVVREENKVHIVNIVWWLQLQYMRVIQSKFTNTNPQKISNSGARARQAGAGSAFGIYAALDFEIHRAGVGGLGRDLPLTIGEKGEGGFPGKKNSFTCLPLSKYL